MEPSEFSVGELITMLERMPQGAKLLVTYRAYSGESEAVGGPEIPYLDSNGFVVIGHVVSLSRYDLIA